jgi:hypothetical protein
MAPAVELRAQPPRPPQPTPALQQALDEHDEYKASREKLERRSMLRGAIVLAVLVVAFSIARAGLDRVFVHGWWRQW